MEKTRLGYARLMVEVNVEENLLEEVDVATEKGLHIKQKVHYEWRPTKFTFCHTFGHIQDECRKINRVTRVWRPVQRATSEAQGQQGNANAAPTQERQHDQQVAVRDEFTLVRNGPSPMIPQHMHLNVDMVQDSFVVLDQQPRLVVGEAPRHVVGEPPT